MDSKHVCVVVLHAKQVEKVQRRVIILNDMEDRIKGIHFVRDEIIDVKVVYVKIKDEDWENLVLI